MSQKTSEKAVQPVEGLGTLVLRPQATWPLVSSSLASGLKQPDLLGIQAASSVALGEFWEPGFSGASSVAPGVFGCPRPTPCVYTDF
jgi:hypothetical protein